MNNFIYGFAFNLTALKYATGDMMNYLGISDTQRKMLLSDYHVLESKKLAPDSPAQFVSEFEISRINTLVRLGKKTQYDQAKTQVTSLEENMIFAAHEQRHNIELGNSPSNINKLPIALGLAAGAAAFMYDGLASGLVMAPTAFSIGFAYKNNANYNEEITCYRYQERIKHLLNINPGQNINSVQLQKKQLQKDFSIAEQISERFVGGYPSKKKRDLIALEEKEWAFKHQAPVLTASQLQNIHDETNTKLMTHQFNFGYL